jgi:hypothetical protein
MLCLHYFTALLLFLLCSIVDKQLLSLFDVLIDRYKVDITHDLVINIPRPPFSWKIHLSDNHLYRNVQQIAYQMQLQSVKLSQRDQQFQWDSE